MKSLVFLVIVGFAFQAAVPSTTTARTTAPTTFSSISTTTVRTTAPTNFSSTTTTPPPSTTTTTVRTTAPTTLSSTTTTTPPITAPETNICLNGGSYDGIKCICPEIYYGPLCENIIDRVIVKTVDTTVKVELKIDNRAFDGNLINYFSEEYKDFEKEFKALMDDAYSGLEGYQRVEIVRLRPGSIIVDHNVIVQLEYKVGVDIMEEYQNVLQIVKKTVNEVKESSQNCTAGNDSCFSFALDYGSVTEVEIPNFCEEIIGDLIEFYTPMVTSEGLTCISHCHEWSPKYLDCNSGRCVIQRNKGPQCLCPRTDIYMYTGPKCTGKIKKLELYGGVGAAIAVLAIIVAIVAFFLCTRKKKTNQNKYMYDDNDESNDYHEITNMGFYKEGPSVNRQYNTDKFKPKRGNFNKG